MAIVKEYMVRMSDGTLLYTTVQLPAETGSFPIIVVRNPYVTKQVDLEALKNEDTHGYAIVIQHCRGCGRSEGYCVPYVNERQDGLDLLDWLRQQPFYQGEFYLRGGSYLSSVHYAYLDTNPPDVKAAMLMVQDCERYNILYRNGFFKMGLHGGWSVGMYKKNQISDKQYCSDTFRTLPLTGITKSIFGEENPWLEAELSHPLRDDPYWQTLEGGADARNAINKSTMPIMFVTAFYDIYTEGVFDMWNGMTEERRSNCALVVTPYSHNVNYDAKTSPCCFPNGGLNEACPDCSYEWFDNIRKGTPLTFARKGEIVYYTLWENKWHNAPMLKNGGTPLTLHLNSGRTLGETAGKSEEITYIHNPFAPASFNGGVCNNFGGMQEQSAPNSRYDIISFLSEPFADKRIFEGGMDASLAVKSDCPDTCFYIRVSIVKGDRTLSLRDDITSLCLQHPDYVPGSTVTLAFHCAPHSFMIEPGDRLRIDVSSSCVPHFTVHTNRRGPQHLQTGADIAHNTIITGKSSLTLYACK